MNDYVNMQFPEDIIVNFLNNGSLFKNDNFEDPEDPFEVTQYLEERSGHESNLAEGHIYYAISTNTAHNIFQKNFEIFYSQVKIGMDSRFYINWNQFRLYDVFKERTWDEQCIAIYMTFHPIIGNGDLGPASIFFNIKQTMLAN